MLAAIKPIEGARFVACLHGDVSQFAMVERRDIVAWNVKEIGDRVMDGDETLKLPW
jgi:hypothetical protein